MGLSCVFQISVHILSTSTSCEPQIYAVHLIVSNFASQCFTLHYYVSQSKKPKKMKKYITFLFLSIMIGILSSCNHQIEDYSTKETRVLRTISDLNNFNDTTINEWESESQVNEKILNNKNDLAE